MSVNHVEINQIVHRIIPSRYPPILLFDWASSPEELEEIAMLEGMTNDRMQTEYGNIHLVAKEDWVSGPGSTPLMAAFTHPGYSRFSDGTYGVYYAADTVETAIAETKFHRERFLRASNEGPCLLQMREYVAHVQNELMDICLQENYHNLLNPDPSRYVNSQSFAREMRRKNVWGLSYPSVRKLDGRCVAIFRPPALSIPIQGSHFDYIWDGGSIVEVRLSQTILDSVL